MPISVDHMSWLYENGASTETLPRWYACTFSHCAALQTTAIATAARMPSAGSTVICGSAMSVTSPNPKRPEYTSVVSTPSCTASLRVQITDTAHATDEQIGSSAS